MWMSRARVRRTEGTAVPRPWDGSVAVVSEGQQGHQGGWSRAGGVGMGGNEATGMMGVGEGEQIMRVL